MNNDLKFISPFKRLCISIGNLPTAYMESMSYYECITFLVKFLENEVIPTVNNNSEVVKELQDYVAHYFDNLDVQSEINNKLDEMATDGTLAEIINSEIFGELNDKVDLINAQDSIFLGDSYAAGTTYEGGSVAYGDSWCTYLKDMIGLTTGHYYIFAQGNAGFAKIGNNSMNFQMTLESHLSDITDKNIIKNIFVCAGYNDNDQTADLIYQRIGEFIAYCKTNFPNAQVYIGMIGGDSRDNDAGATVRQYLLTKVLNAYNRCGDFGGVYLSGVEKFTHNFYQFNEQGNHPNTAGYKYAARMIYNAWKGGSANLYEPITSVSLTTKYSNTWAMQSEMVNDNKILFIDDYTKNGINISEMSSTYLEIVEANTNNKVIKSSIAGKIQIPCDLYLYDGENRYRCAGRILINNDGSVGVSSTIFAHVTAFNDIVIRAVTTTWPIMLS